MHANSLRTYILPPAPHCTARLSASRPSQLCAGANAILIFILVNKPPRPPRGRAKQENNLLRRLLLFYSEPVRRARSAPEAAPAVHGRCEHAHRAVRTVRQAAHATPADDDAISIWLRAEEAFLGPRPLLIPEYARR